MEAKMNYLLTVNLTDAQTGNIVIECVKCEQSITINAEMAQSPFWDMHVGRATLVMLYHVTQEHKDDASKAETAQEGHADIPPVPDRVPPPSQSTS
jgi:hypothetical protein